MTVLTGSSKYFRQNTSKGYAETLSGTITLPHARDDGVTDNMAESGHQGKFPLAFTRSD